MKQIEITITRDGIATVEAVGYSGGSCVEDTKVFDVLGEKVSETFKSEYYETPLRKEKEFL